MTLQRCFFCSPPARKFFSLQMASKRRACAVLMLLIAASVPFTVVGRVMPFDEESMTRIGNSESAAFVRENNNNTRRVPSMCSRTLPSKETVPAQQHLRETLRTVIHTDICLCSTYCMLTQITLHVTSQYILHHYISIHPTSLRHYTSLHLYTSLHSILPVPF